MDISLIRKLDVLSFTKSSCKTFNFDFVKLEAVNFNAKPSEYFSPKGVKIEVGHSAEQKQLIDQYINQYGISEASFGYILSSASNFNKFYRELNAI